MRPLQSLGEDGGPPSDAVEAIAVVGLATRFPQEATTTEDLWQILLQARSTWSTIPKERFNADAFYHPDPEHGGTVSNAYNEGKMAPIMLTILSLAHSSKYKVVIFSQKTPHSLTDLFSTSQKMSS